MALNASSRLPLRFWIVALVAFVNAVGFTLIIPLIYPYAKAFGLSDFQVSLLTTAYAAAQFVGTPVLGRLSDRLGRKPLLIISLMGTVVANLIASVTPVAGLLFAARILDGATGDNTSIALAIISDSTDPEQRTRAFGIFGALFRLGFIAGPPLSYLALSIPPLPRVSSLGMGFLLAAAIAAIATLLSVFLLSETLPCEARGSFQLTWKDFGLVDMLKAVGHPKYGQVFLLIFFSGFTFTIFTFAFQPFFLIVLGQNARSLAIAFATFGVMGFFSQVFGLEPLRRRFDLVHILAFMLAARGVLFLLIPVWPNIVAFGAGLIIFGAVNSFPKPLIDTILSFRCGPSEQGSILGINASYLSISNAIGPATAGLLVSISYALPFWITGLLTLLTAWFALRLQNNPASLDSR